MSSVSISCLPPKPPPTRAASTRTRLCVEAEEPAERVAGEERHLGAAADDEAAVVVEPAERAMGFQRGVLHAVGDVGGLVHRVGGGEAGLDVAEPPWTAAATLRSGSWMRLSGALACRIGGAGAHRRFRVEDGGQQVVLDLR